jgi:predicted TIM-barrel fold metal-dependent hydrolase
MLFDIHVHMGQYFDDYYTPPRILRTLKAAGITHFAYSSTSTVVTDDPGFLLEERVAMHELSGGRAVPILWVTHDMLKNSRDLSLYMDDAGGRIAGLKIHGESEKWLPFLDVDKDFRRVFDIAKERGMFVKVHTGEKSEWCEAGAFGNVCKKYRDVPVILAHGRPLSTAIYVLIKNPNAYVDTSFMPHEHLRELIGVARERGFPDRILFGTDTPIPGRHLKSSLPRHLRGRIATSKEIAGKDWKKISWKNAQKLVTK